MKLLLFLGAGVSIPSGLPPAAKLTDELFKPSGDDSEGTKRVRALLRVIADQDTADIQRVGPYPLGDGFAASGAIYRGKASTYEDLYFLCEEISLWNVGLSDNCLTTPFMERIAECAGDVLTGSSPEARLWELGRLGRPACEFIGAVVTKTLCRQYKMGFDLIHDLAVSPQIDELSIVTLNHDTLVEEFLTDREIEFADGFGECDGDVRWSRDNVYDQENRVRLFKLHGSVNWFAFQRNGRLQTATFVGDNLHSAQDSSGRPLSAEYLSASFLSGLNKSISYDRGIYADIHFRFAELLRRCDRIVMSGYGWGDAAINFQLQAWFDRSRDNKLLLLHEASKTLRDGSMTMATGYSHWIGRGQLICNERWLCDTPFSDLREFLDSGGERGRS